MKHVKSFMLLVIALVFAASCGNTDAKNIISIQKASAKKCIDSFEKFENNFILRSDIADNGYEKAEFFLTDYDIQGKNAEELLQSAVPFIDAVIENQIGMTYRFINDKKAKEFKISYTLDNILKNEAKTEIINIVIGQKNVEAASPAIFNKAFSIPAQDLGKALALIAPKEIPANLNIDLTYNALKALSTIQPDKASQKRYDKIQEILYKNASIVKNGNTYTIVFNNDDMIKSIAATVDAVKNDNRLKFFWGFYEKLFEKEFKEIEEQFNEIKDKIKDCVFTEELTVKDNLVANDMYTLVVSGKEIVKLESSIKNYDNPIDGMTYAITITDPKIIDKDTNADIISFIFTSEGKVTDTIADIDYSASISFLADSSTSPLSGIDMHYYFYADTTKQDDNFEIGMDVTTRGNIDNENKDTKPVVINLMIQALGTVAKTADMITYKIDNIGMEMAMPDMEKYAINLETNASMTFNKNILEDITMPKETVKVLETKVTEWQSIKEKITTNILTLSGLLNL